MKDTSLINT